MDANFSAVIGLPTNVGSIPSAPCNQIHFQGSPDEQFFAFRVAISMDIRTGMEKGVPYVTSQKDLEKSYQAHCILQARRLGKLPKVSRLT